MTHAPRRITVMWVEAGSAADSPEVAKLNRHDRRVHLSVERQLRAMSKDWPVYRCMSGHLARVDPEVAHAFGLAPCEKCGEAVVRDGEKN